MKRAPKELLDALRGIAERNSGLYVENSAQEIYDILEDRSPIERHDAAYVTTDGAQSEVGILRKDVAEWKAKAEKAEREAKDAYHRGYRQGEQDTAEDGRNGRYFGQYNG